MLATQVELTESDFETDTGDGNFIPVIDIGEDSQYYVTYGHVPFDEMLEYCDQMITYIGEDADQFNLSEEDVSWAWATASTQSYNHSPGEFTLRWSGVGPDVRGSFPITLVSLW